MTTTKRTTSFHHPVTGVLVTAIHEETWLRFDVEARQIPREVYETREAIECALRRPSLINRVATDEEADQIVRRVARDQFDGWD